MKLIEKVSAILKEENRAVTVGHIVDMMVKAGDPFTKLPKHSKYVELGYHKTVLQSMTADVYTAVKSAEDAGLHDIIIDRSVKPLTVFLKSAEVRPEKSFIKFTFTDDANGKTLVEFMANGVTKSGMTHAIKELVEALADA